MFAEQSKKVIIIGNAYHSANLMQSKVSMFQEDNGLLHADMIQILQRGKTCMFL